LRVFLLAEFNSLGICRVCKLTAGPGGEFLLMANITNSVAEFQGLYGPFTVAERVLQKIWLHRDFDLGQMCLTDGRRLEIISPGKWNLLDGPDFHGAEVRIDGLAVRGDVEVHFHAADWRAHGHPADPNYAGVVLHVLLFPPDKASSSARRSDGTEIPTLVLLPLLHRDLEEYAADDALEGITARDEWRRFADLGREPLDEIRRVLHENAMERWRQKVHFAKLRVKKLGWTDAVHHTALEILGYRRNRAAMLALAARYPLRAWVEGVRVEDLFEAGAPLWQLHGVRPANHPRGRLEQYAAWIRAYPDWPEALRLQATVLPEGRVQDLESVRQVRQRFALSKCRRELAQIVTGDAVGGTRFDTLVCDGFLPLVAGLTNREMSGLWSSWFLGDVPLAVRHAMSRLGVSNGRENPFCHGYGQGLLGWILEHSEPAST